MEVGICAGLSFGAFHKMKSISHDDKIKLFFMSIEPK